MKENNLTEKLKKSPYSIKDILFKTEISLYITHIVLSIILGLTAGFGAILFHYLLEKMRFFFEPKNFTKLFNVDNNFIIIIPIIGGILSASMTRLFPSIAKEKGVLSVIKAIILNNGLIPLKNLIFHLFAPIICIGTGAPLGPEGPAAKIGSGLGSLMSQIFKLNRNDMMMYTSAGAGAAISAVFNAPIAGVFFGIEVILLNDLKNRALSVLIISSVVANILSRAVLGDNHIFTIPTYNLGSEFYIYPLFLLLGILTGITSILYFTLKKIITTLFDEKLKIKNEFIKLLPLCLVFGIILIKYYQLFGIGYSTINSVLNNAIQLNDVLILLILKIIFLVLFLKAGAYGGTFAPSLSIGAFLGFSFASITNLLFNTGLDPIVFALVGMGGVLAGINSIPLTAIMLVFEITNDYKFILPLMLVSIISYLVTIYYNKGNVYSVELMEDGIDVSKRGEIDLLGKIKVNDLLKKDFDLVNHKMPFRELLKYLLDAKYGDVFVVDDNLKLIGMISLKDVRQAIIDKDLADLLIARDMTIPIPAINDDDPVSLALQKIEKYDIENIPVVKRNTKDMVGLLTHQDIIQAYNTLIEEWETNQLLVNYNNKTKE